MCPTFAALFAAKVGGSAADHRAPLFARTPREGWGRRSSTLADLHWEDRALLTPSFKTTQALCFAPGQ